MISSISLRHRRINIIVLLWSLSLTYAFGQYTFNLDKKILTTSIKNQDKTGTCWSFASSSFLESEILRRNSENVDLSEMYVVRHIYLDKAKNYISRQGQANFSEGGLAHDLVRSISKYGIVPEIYYTGKGVGQKHHDHTEMIKGIKGYLDGIRGHKTLSSKWQEGVEAILDVYLGKPPEKFEIDGQLHTPRSYAYELGFKKEEYISITSFNHHSFYEKFILEIPDNYSNGNFHNIPIDELVEITEFAIISGYSLVWDGDISEPGFNATAGLAILPASDDLKQCMESPCDEIYVDQAIRQKMFESYETTDDHLMHLTGIAIDQRGVKYFILKNSWGNQGEFEGYIYMSEAYFRAKTISIMLNKNALPKKTNDRLFVSH